MRTPTILFIVILAISCLMHNIRLCYIEGKENKHAISKIIEFRQKTGRFPQHLEDMGLISKLEGPLYYILREDGSCLLYRSGVLGESEIVFAGAP